MNFKQAEQADAYALRKYFSSHSFEDTKTAIDRLLDDAPADGKRPRRKTNDIANMVFLIFNLSSLVHHVDKMPIVSKHYPLADAILQTTSVEDIERALCDGLIQWLTGKELDAISLSIMHMIPFFELKTMVRELEREGGAQC